MKRTPPAGPPSGSKVGRAPEARAPEPRARVLLAAKLLALAAIGLAAAPGAAQERTGERRAGPSGWLGLGLNEVMECRRPSGQEQRWCERRLVVVQLHVDGPADRAGVEVGDTLLALDDEPLVGLSEQRRERAFASLVPGESFRLRVGRDGGRRTLALRPARRPAALGELRWRSAGPVAADPPAAVAPRPLVLEDPGAPPDGGRFVVTIQSDSGDVVRIRPVPAAPPWPAADREVVYVDSAGRSVYRLQLGPEFDAFRDSVLRHARVRLDSLRRVTRVFPREAAPAAPVARSPDAPPPLPALALERRLAGAEFARVDRQLAEYFAGVDGGLLVLRVLSGTPASRLGLAAGDVVVEAGGRPVREMADLRGALSGDGRGVRIRWVRKGRVQEGVLQER